MEPKKDILKTALLEAVSQALENMAFEEVDLVDETSMSRVEVGGNLWAILPIVTPLSGEMILSLSPECARRITENIYGTLEDGQLEKGADLDAVAEILNTIAGRFVHALVPSNQSFDFGLPKTGKGAVPVIPPQVITSVSIDAGGHIVTAIVVGEDFRNLVNP